MFLELVDHLRCTRPHEESWLVAAARRMEARHVVDGELGCPVCRTEYPVREAVADFRDGAAGPPPDAVERAVAADAAADDGLLRAAALLQLVDVRQPVVLAGAWAALAPGLVELIPAVYLAVNAAERLPLRPELSALRTRGALPLARGAAHAVALDTLAAADVGLLRGAVAALRPGGRLVAPVATALPDGVRELARDERQWVAERVAVAAATAPVPLTRRS
ncbi:MAG TPA: hypothetical protein VFS08_05160 [Gemmatimonadaceae bacterium]|nr:hypothetical protein [Gemmatimonadaceae bacterium]